MQEEKYMQNIHSNSKNYIYTQSLYNIPLHEKGVKIPSKRGRSDHKMAEESDEEYIHI